MIGRLVRSADYQQVLSHPPRARSPHFAVHHLFACPSRSGTGSAKAGKHELSTGTDLRETLPVDESPASTPDRLWLGTVVPKRHARRSVTRSLLKRQMRSALQQQADQLPAGLYVIRLRAPFDRSNFVSAVSSALRAVAAGELTQLVRDAAVRLARR